MAENTGPTVAESNLTTADERREAQAKEYGVYVATEAINIDGVRAFNKGDPVPVSHVTRGVVSKDSVRKRG